MSFQKFWDEELPPLCGEFSQVTTTMACQIPKFFSRRVCQPSSPFQKLSSQAPRSLRASIRNSPARRNYATGESGPKPKPGQSPFKIWPFVAITLVGSGAYMLMVKNRTGTWKLCHLTAPLQINSWSIREPLKRQDSSDAG